MIYLLLSFLIPIFTGFLLIILLWPGLKSFKSELILKICLSVGLGFGISSLVYFIWLVAIGPQISGILIEASLLFCLILVFLYKTDIWDLYIKKRSARRVIAGSKIRWILMICFYVLLLSSVIAFIYISIRNPHGKWDAVSIWNIRAKYLFGAVEWRDAFSSTFASIDYPLMLSGFIARCWEYIGLESVVIPPLVAMFFTFATVGLIFSALSIIRSDSQGLLSGIFLLGTPLFITHGASQGADVPLGFFSLPHSSSFALLI